MKIIHYCAIIPNNMASQDGKRTAKIVFGEILVSEFSKNPNKIFTTKDLMELAKLHDIHPTNIAEIIKREFAGAISYDYGQYTLSTDWGVDGLLDAVNDQRRSVKLPPLELPNPSIGDRTRV